MPSRVTIFNHYGSPIAELNTSTTRSWILNDVGRCQFNLATFNNPSCTRTILQYGNFVLVQHIPTRDGAGNIRGTLPPWIGVIMPPQEWSYGIVTVTAYSAEYVMALRPMPYVFSTGTAGQVFTDLVRFSNDLGGFPVQTGQVYQYSAITEQNLRLSAYEEALSMSRWFSQDWDITYQQTTGNQLSLFANWYSQKGVNVNAVFSEGIHGNMKLPRLTEQGSIANTVYGYNLANSSSSRLQSVKYDYLSQGDYGVWGVNQAFNLETQGGLDAATQSYINEHARPTITLELVALDEGDTFSKLATGNIWKVVLNSVGFTGGRIGFNSSVRLTGMEYDDYTNEVRLSTQILTSGLTESNYA